MSRDLIDARGLKCPLPVLKLEKAMGTLAEGETLAILVTDPVARIDIPLFCGQNGHGVEVLQEPGDVLRFIVTKGAASG